MHYNALATLTGGYERDIRMSMGNTGCSYMNMLVMYKILAMFKSREHASDVHH